MSARLREISTRLRKIEDRLVRVESRVVQIMNHFAIRPKGAIPDHKRRPKERAP